MRSFILAVAVVALLSSTVMVSAQRQDMKLSDRMKFANHVFTGTVTSCEEKDVSLAPTFPDWITRHYKCVVHVDKVVKTAKHHKENPSHPADETVVAGTSVHVMSWKATSRPDDFKGDTGVTSVPIPGQSYSFFGQFLHPDPQLRHMFHKTFPHKGEEEMKAFNVLVPNGITSADELDNYNNNNNKHSHVVSHHHHHDHEHEHHQH